MSRKIIDMERTVSEPVVLAIADSYSELSDDYDDDFNPATWCAGSIGVVFGEDGIEYYALNLSHEWVDMSGESDEGGE